MIIWIHLSHITYIQLVIAIVKNKLRLEAVHMLQLSKGELEEMPAEEGWAQVILRLRQHFLPYFDLLDLVK